MAADIAGLGNVGMCDKPGTIAVQRTAKSFYNMTENVVDLPANMATAGEPVGTDPICMLFVF